MDTIAFDIEVAGLPWEEVDQATRDYLLSRAAEEADREALPERMALFPGLGRVIAIGMWNLEQGRGMMLLEGEQAADRDWDRVPDTTLVSGPEEVLLARFWDVLERKRPRLVSFNGRGYDGPMLMIRSAQLGIPCSRNLVPNRYNILEHCDLSDVLGFMGARREMYRLDYWCRRFGVQSPKGGMDGSQVGPAYRAGRLQEIGEYCLRDVRATGELYQKLEHSLLPLFQGGPRRSS